MPCRSVAAGLLTSGLIVCAFTFAYHRNYSFIIDIHYIVLHCFFSPYFFLLTPLFIYFLTFSLTLYSITATGRPPWPEFSNNLAALFHVATSKVPPDFPPNASPMCTDFLSKCLVIDPIGRCSADELMGSCEFMQE